MLGGGVSCQLAGQSGSVAWSSMVWMAWMGLQGFKFWSHFLLEKRFVFSNEFGFCHMWLLTFLIRSP